MLVQSKFEVCVGVGGAGRARGCQRKCPPEALVVGFRVF